MTSADDRLRAIVVSEHPESVSREFGLLDHIDVVGVASTAEEAAQAVDDSEASVAAVDTSLPDGVVDDAIQELAHHDPPVGVIALAAAPLDDVVVSRALKAGAHGLATPRTIADHGAAPFSEAVEGRTFLPDAELRELLVTAESTREATSAKRDRLLRNVVLGLVPLGGVMVALVELLWRQYLEQIGVRPEELDVDAATRVADLFFTVSVLTGLIGPLFFVGSWLDLVIGAVNERVADRLRRHRALSSIGLAVLTLAVTFALLQAATLLFALLFGPFVASLLLAKMFDLDDDLPRVLRIERIRPGQAIIATIAIMAIFISVVSYEVAVRGPDFDESGEVGWIAPSVFGFRAEPVRVTDVEGGSVTEMLYLGSNGDIYLLADPCADGRVDYVSAGATQLTVIARVDCG